QPLRVPTSKTVFDIRASSGLGLPIRSYDRSTRRNSSVGRTAQRQRHDAAGRLGLDEVEREALGLVAEEALAGAEHDREDHQPQLVDEVVLEQRLHELTAAGDQEL